MHSPKEQSSENKGVVPHVECCRVKKDKYKERSQDLSTKRLLVLSAREALFSCVQLTFI